MHEYIQLVLLVILSNVGSCTVVLQRGAFHLDNSAWFSSDITAAVLKQCHAAAACVVLQSPPEFASYRQGEHESHQKKCSLHLGLDDDIWRSSMLLKNGYN